MAPARPDRSAARAGPPASEVARLDLLGVVEFRAGGAARATGGQHQTAILAHLALQAPRRVAVEAVIDAVWGDHPPATVRHSLSTQVSRLRRIVEAGGWRIDWSAGGYLLEAPEPVTDAAAFALLVQEATELAAIGRIAEAVGGLRSALALWRGDPLGGLPDAPFVIRERRTLLQRRRAAEDDLARLLLQADRPEQAITLLEELATADPLDEQRWSMLVEALDRAGRPAEALTAAHTARTHLRETLGLEPGRSLRASELRVIDRALPTAVEARPLVGRAAEVAAVSRAIATARDTGPRLVVVAGPRNGGRSRMLEEVRARAAGSGRAVLIRATPGGTPLLPVLDAALAAGDPIAPASSGGAGGGHAVAGALARRVLESIEAVHAVSERAPVTICIDDLDHADPATLALTRTLVLGRSAPVLVAVTTTDDPTDEVRTLIDELAATGRTTVIRVGPLSRIDARQMALALGADPATADSAVSAAGGLPGRIADLASSRTDAPIEIGTRARDVLAAIAVAGIQASISLVADMTDLYPREVLDATDRAIATGLLRAGDDDEVDRHLAFVHEEERAATIASLADDHRRALHLLAARAIRRRRGDHVEIARHLLEVGDLASIGHRVEAFVAGADAALDAAAIELARRFLDAACSIADPDDERRLELLVRRAEVDFALGDSAAGSAGADEVVRTAAAIGRWDLAAEASIAESNLGFPPDITSANERMRRIDPILDGLGVDRPSLRARLLTWVAHTLANVDHDRAVAALAEADRLMAPQDRTRSALEAARIRLLASSRADPHAEMSLAARLGHRCRDEGDPLGRAMASIMWTTAAIRAGEPIEPAAIDEGVEIARASTQPAAEYYALSARAAALTAMATTSTAEAAVEAAERFGLERHLPGALLTGAMQRWPLRREQCRLEEFAPLVEHLARTSDRPESAVFLAATRFELGDRSGVADIVEAFVDARLDGHPQDWVRDGYCLIAADLAADLELAHLAEALYAALLARSGTVIVFGSTSMALGPADRVLARLAACAGRTADAAGHLDTATAIAQRTRSALWEGWCTLEAVRLGIGPTSERHRRLERAAQLAARAESERLTRAVASADSDR